MPMATVIELQPDKLGYLPEVKYTAEKNDTTLVNQHTINPQKLSGTEEQYDTKTKGFQKVYLLMILFGLSYVLPYNMFITATAYFEDKFSNTTDTIELNFPSYFQLGSQVSNAAGAFFNMIAIKLIKIPTSKYLLSNS